MLRVLIFDDDEDDAVLLERALAQGGLHVDCEKVTNRAAFDDAARRDGFHLVVLDYNIPGFGGLEALAVVRERDADVPVIMVSGAVGEEVAVEAMKAGAQDVVLKDNLSRLVPAVERELSEAEVRRQRRRADEELVRTVQRLNRTLQGAVDTIADLAEVRDPYTAGHQLRVTELAVAVGVELGLDEEAMACLRVAGTLHDIGKISVPAEILTKPGRLTPVEFELIKVHPQTGYDILRGIEFPWPVADVVVAHHERLDGSGYPEGAAGPEISREARILAVADVVEAMSSDRPYRPALGVEAALDEVRSRRETAYDPDAVDACVALFEERRFAFAQDGGSSGDEA